MRTSVYFVIIFLLFSCTTSGEYVILPERKHILIHKEPNHEYLDCKVYPEIIYKKGKRKCINIYMNFMYDSTFTNFWKRQQEKIPTERMVKDKTLFFEAENNCETGPFPLFCYRRWISTYCNFFQQRGYYKTKHPKWHDNWYWVNISVPGWVKFSFYKETRCKIIFNKKRGTENEYSHNGIMNFEKIDTIWISTLYNDIIIPIDTVTKTTEKIPLPF